MKCECCNKEHDGKFATGRFCNRSCANTRKPSKNTKEKISRKLKGRRIGRARLFFKGYEDRKCPICNKEFTVKVTNTRQTCGSKECRNKLIQIKTIGKCGGYRKNSFRGKSFHYKTKDNKVVFLQSTYELKVAQELDNNNIKWVRPEPLRWIDKDEKKHQYYPDFYLLDFDIYLDPKNGIGIEKDKEKISLCSDQNKVRILILKKEELVWEIIKNKIGSLISI